MPGTVNLQLIRKIRTDKGYSYNEMAKALGLKEPEKYYRREIGRYNFKATELPPLASKLGIPISKIFK